MKSCQLIIESVSQYHDWLLPPTFIPPLVANGTPTFLPCQACKVQNDLSLSTLAG